MAPPLPVDLQTVIDMLISNMNGKGGTSAANLNLLGNDIFGAVTGTSNDKPLLTQEEAVAQYQPTLANILSTGDANSVEYNLADLIARGVPVVTIKREILKSITDGTIPPEEEDIMMSFVDTLDKEQRSYQEYLRKPVEDSNTKMGLPAKTERYNPVDIAPEVFQSMLSKMDTAQKGVNERIGKINATSGNPTVYEQPKVQTKSGDYINFLNEKNPNYTKNIQEERRNNANELAATAPPAGAYLDYLNGKNPNYNQQVIDSRIEREAVKKNQRSGDSKSMSKDGTKKIDAKATAFNKAQIDYLKELAGAPAPTKRQDTATSKYTQAVNLRDPVAAQQRVMELTAAKIAAGLEKMNYTPGNIAMIQKLIAARGMQNG